MVNEAPAVFIRDIVGKTQNTEIRYIISNIYMNITECRQGLSGDMEIKYYTVGRKNH